MRTRGSELSAACLLLALVWAGSAWAQDPDFAAHDCTDAGCHATMLEQRYVHPAIEDGGCESCHSESDRPHRFEEVEAVSSLCGMCHDIEGDGVWQHAGGDAVCTDCHDPHGSRWEHLLIAPVRDLCRTCHDAPGVEREFGHRPAREGRCTSCHDPHHPESTPLLRSTMPELCVHCHRDLRPVEGESGAHLVELGEECTTCHSPHGSDWPRLLEDPYSGDLYLSDPEQEVSLCFGCHGDLLEVDGDTAFRDADGRNLHLVHVGIENKGRSCRTCHEMHVRGRYRLLRRSYRMRSWTAQMIYSRDEREATCAPACHEARSYPIEE